MQLGKKRRGRPVGTGRDDSTASEAIADLLVKESSLNPTAAIKRTLSSPNDSDVRRLQIKWKASARDALESARRRQSVPTGRTLPRNEYRSPVSHASVIAMMHSIGEGPSRLAIDQFRCSEKMLVLREAANRALQVTQFSEIAMRSSRLRTRIWPPCAL
jgi:hypothetical protein